MRKLTSAARLICRCSAIGSRATQSLSSNGFKARSSVKRIFNSNEWQKLKSGGRYFSSDAAQDRIGKLNEQLQKESSNAELFFELGLEYSRQGAGDLALSSFQRAVDLKPNEWKYLFNLATQQLENGLIDRSIRSFEAALKLDDRPESYSNLGFAYRQKGRVGDAVAVLRRGIKKHPNVAKLWNNLGIVMLQSPAFKPMESVEQCRKATQLDSSNAEFRHNLATALRDAEQYEDANTEYHKAIVLMKQNTESAAVALADAYHNWALCLQKMGQLESAAEKWQDAVKSDPNHKEAMANLIASLFVMQDDYNANKYMEEAKKRSSDPNGFVVLVATAIRDAGRPDDAEKYFKQVIESDSNATEAYVELGVTLAEKGQFDKAIPMFAKAVALAPKDARSWNYLGAARRHHGDVDGAEEAYKMSLKCDPEYMEAVENLAFIYFEKNDDPNATRLYERLVASRPNDADIHSSLAILYQRNGAMDKAEKHRDMALKLNPNDWMAVFNTAMYHFQNKDMVKANEYFDKAIQLNPSLAQDFEPFRKQLEEMPDLNDANNGSNELSEEKLQQEMARFEQLLNSNDFRGGVPPKK
eukprot:TRINITY_DN15031_c0_g1_i1.p2 TRINITY_DN15031_c0_g1~~TRINITY_DN15031_c0_g1_i1.p2  ORF type:complete len:585 (-),score=156.48 TRINITY_DN15031_c0_g1_i1:2958-4712(-)